MGRMKRSKNSSSVDYQELEAYSGRYMEKREDRYSWMPDRQSLQIHVDSESKEPLGTGRGKFSKYGFRQRNSDRIPSSMSFSVRRVMEKRSQELKNIGYSLGIGNPRVVIREDLKLSEKRLFDPQDKVLQMWNKLFIISCVVAVFVDPLFFYVPLVDDELNCLDIDKNLAIVISILRSFIDIFYLVRMVLQFRTAFTSPSSLVFGRGELVMDPMQIAKKYLSTYFIIDFLAVLPLPQVIIWIFVPKLTGSNALYTKNALRFIIFSQYLPRLFRMFPLNAEVVRTSGRFNQTAWPGAVYNLLLFVLAGHVVGACWYLFAVDRMVTCWKEACEPDNNCIMDFVYCGNKVDDGFNVWRETGLQELSSNCTVDNAGISSFNYGIYTFGLRLGVVASRKFVQKYFFCFFWGLQQLSTLCQGLSPTSYFGEELFSISVIVLGLILMALLISNMQTYLQSSTSKLEEMRLKKTDAEQWMHRRFLPEDLRNRVRQHSQYRWIETRGVNEEHLIQNLPKDLRRDIRRHLCLDLVKQVHLFKNMDDCVLDAICEHLKTSLYTEDACIVREGDYIDEMSFIIWGRIESVTTNGGRIGFFNHGVLKQGDFCGEELLSWALDPKSGASLPLSTRTVKALSEVEVFSLSAKDLKIFATQFRRLHSKQVQHTFRFHSQHWRTWAACFIQATWRRHCRRKHAEFLLRKQQKMQSAMVGNNSTVSSSSRAAFYASSFATEALHAMRRKSDMKLSERATQLVELPKPSEPDFSAEDYENVLY